MTSPPDTAAMVEKLTVSMREALNGAFVDQSGRVFPRFSCGCVFDLERAKLSEPYGAWSTLTPLGITVRNHLLKTGNAD